MPVGRWGDSDPGGRWEGMLLISSTLAYPKQRDRFALNGSSRAATAHDAVPQTLTGDRRPSKRGTPWREKRLSGGTPAGRVGTVASGASAQSSSTSCRPYAWPEDCTPAVAAGEGPPLALPVRAPAAALAAALRWDPVRALPLGLRPGTSTA